MCVCGKTASLTARTSNRRIHTTTKRKIPKDENDTKIEIDKRENHMLEQKWKIVCKKKRADVLQTMAGTYDIIPLR